MKSKSRSGKQKKEGKRNLSSTEQIKVARVIYGTKTLAECMEAVIMLHMER